MIASGTVRTASKNSSAKVSRSINFFFIHFIHSFSLETLASWKSSVFCDVFIVEPIAIRDQISGCVQTGQNFEGGALIEGNLLEIVARGGVETDLEI